MKKTILSVIISVLISVLFWQGCRAVMSEKAEKLDRKIELTK